MEAVLQRLSASDVKDFIEWFFLTGMRPNEIRSLIWTDLDR